jgi:type I restriction enzyme M protein
VVTTAEIAEHGYVLTPGRYVGSEAIEDEGEPLDVKIARLAAVIRLGFKKREELEAAVLAAMELMVVADE